MDITINPQIESEETHIIKRDNEFKKSNFIISSVYKSTLVENKTLAVILSRIQTAHEDAEGSLTCSVRVETLRELFQFKGNGFYTYLDEIGRRMTAGGRTIGFSNPAKHEFMYVPLITKAECKNGEFKVRFAPEMKPYLRDLEGQFSIIPLETMLEFDSVYSLRLYELMKSMAWAPKNVAHTDNDEYCIEVNLSQLKLQMGVVNGETQKIKAVLTKTGKKGMPDYDLAVSKAEEKIYENFGQFNRRCLAPSVEEINKKPTGMNIRYERIKGSGRGGITVGIRFFVKLKDENMRPKSVVTFGEYDSEDDFLDALRSYIGPNITVKTSELRTVAELAKYDMEILIKAIDYTKEKEPDNFIGYLISTIKNDYMSHQENAKEDNIVNIPADHVKETPPLRAEEYIKKLL